MGAAAVLTILKNGETIKSCPIEGEVVLGRADGCVIRLDDRAISRQHAIFKVVADGVQVEKKSEFAPLSVNGAECTRAIVKEADIIAIGPYLLRVSMAKAAAADESETAAPEGTVSLSPLDAPAAPAGSHPASKPPEALSETGSAAADPELGEAPNDLSEHSPELLDPNLPEGAQPGLELGGGAAIPGIEGSDQPEGLSLESQEPAMGDPLGLSVSDEPLEAADEDAKTKLTPAAKLSVKLVFPQGSANVTEFDLTGDEVSIGRGNNCDIILNDKKASRKNAIIRRAGLSFSIKDLGSANGTFVNGARVTEQELAGDDRIRIGNVEFRFKAMSADYESRQKDFMPVPVDPDESEAPSDNFPATSDPAMDPAGQLLASDLMGQAQAQPHQLGLDASAAPAGVTGIAGIGPPDLKNMGILEKLRNFKDLPPRQRILYIICGGAIFYLLILPEIFPEPEAPQQKPKPKPSAVAVPLGDAPASFATLSADKQRFVDAQYNLAFDHFKGKEYDKALYELDKIFLIINDYKDARDIERYAREGKRKLEAFEEEKRRKEEEARLKAKVAELVEECRQRMDKKHYEQAQELFAQITVLDPENTAVGAWKREIEEYEESKRLDAQAKQVQEEINKRAREIYNEGVALRKQGKFHSAIDVFGKVGDIGANDASLAQKAKKMISFCRAAIKARREPVLAEAQTAETAGELPKAFDLYKQATLIDPPHKAGYAGMNRIRGILHDRAKLIYTEAVLAESYSDFALARKKFKECLDVAPVDDIYYERATRKLARYFRKEDQSDERN